MKRTYRQSTNQINNYINNYTSWSEDHIGGVSFFTGVPSSSTLVQLHDQSNNSNFINITTVRLSNKSYLLTIHSPNYNDSDAVDTEKLGKDKLNRKCMVFHIYSSNKLKAYPFAYFHSITNKVQPIQTIQNIEVP